MRTSLLIAAATTAVWCSPQASTLVELRPEAPLLPPWVPQEAAAAAAATERPMPVIIALQQRNLATIPAVVHGVSHPLSEKYGQHWSVAELAAHTKPEEATVAAVQGWLRGGLGEQRYGEACRLQAVSEDQFHCQLRVAEVEALFATSVRTVVNPRTRQTARRAGAIRVPASVRPAIAAVYGVHGLPLPPRRAVLTKPEQQQTYPVTPDTITTRYNVNGVVPSGDLSVRQAVAEFQGQFANQTDLTTFFKKYLPNAKPGDDQVYKYIGEKLTGEGIEALLDIQYIMGVAPGVKTEFWEFPGNDFCLDLKNWTATLLTQQDVPVVHSISYGWQGNLTQVGCLDPEVDDIDAAFAKIAARGLSLIFASGDSGSGEQLGCAEYVNQVFSGTVVTNNSAHTASDCCAACGKDSRCGSWSFSYIGKQVCTIFAPGATTKVSAGYVSGLPQSKMLWPIWPASSPWVTAVGATRFVDQKPGSEMATDSFGSGGGLSFQFPQPSWQTDAVDQYFKAEPSNKLPDPSTYNRNGRGTPDLAALGDGYQVIVQGQPMAVGGTSAATPAFAAMVSLINEARFKQSKKPLGYLNLWLYQNQPAFMDVTVGSNRFGRGPFPLPDGWDCVEGWDPATGFGTPDFQKLLQSALQLP